MKQLLLSLLLMTTLSAGAATNYYVSATSGVNTNNGLTTTNAFQTIQYAVSASAPGDTINVMADVYSITSPIIITHGLMIRKHGTGKALLDAQSWSAATPYKIILTVDNAHNVSIEGLDFANCIGTGSKAIYAHGWCTDLVINSCTIRNIGWISNNLTAIPTSQLNDNAYAIHMVGDATVSISRPVISNCHISNCATGFSEAVALTGHINSAFITRNVIDSIANIGLVLAGNYLPPNGIGNPDSTKNQCTNAIVSFNTVMHCMSAQKNAAGIYIDGARNCTIENNKLFENAVGISVGAEQPLRGNVVQQNIIRNNEVVNNAVAGMVLGADNMHGNSVLYTLVCNNTFYKNRTGKHINGVTTINGQPSSVFANIHGGEVHLQNIIGMELQNNIIHALDTTRHIVALDGYGMDQFHTDYNLYHRDNNTMSFVIGNGVTAFNNLNVSAVSGYYALNGAGGNKSLQTIGLDSNSLLADPLFNNAGAGNFTLKSKSPAWDKGNPDIININPGVTDLLDSPRIVGPRVDIGAYEYPVQPIGIAATNKSSFTHAKFYPNPTDNKLKIEIELQHPQGLSVAVTDITGKKVLVSNLVLYSAGTNVIPISLHNTIPGTYIITVLDSNGTPLWSSKLLKQ